MCLSVRGCDIAAPSPRPPIFIVGSPRSGTTLTRLVLDSHPSIACGPETHFLTDIETVTTKHWYRIERFGYDKEYWYARARVFYGGFLADYAASKGKSRWADKSPGYAQHLPYVLDLFPDAQVIHVVRDAEAVVASWAKRWGMRRAMRAPQVWVDSVSAARTFGATLPPTQYREVRFEQLVGDPEAGFRELFAWLGEDWDPAVLDYDRHEHDSGGRNKTISSASRESGGTAINAVRASDRPKLNPVLRARTKLVAGALNRELGY